MAHLLFQDILIDDCQKKIAYYQIVSTALITSGSVLIASWFVIFTGGVIQNQDWLFLEGTGMLGAGVILLVLGIMIPLIGIRRA